jgi:hypothetical protein
MTINIYSNKALRQMLNENDLTKIRPHEIVFSSYKVEEVMKGGERVGRQSTPFMNRGSRQFAECPGVLNNGQYDSD